MYHDIRDCNNGPGFDSLDVGIRNSRRGHKSTRISFSAASPRGGRIRLFRWLNRLRWRRRICLQTRLAITNFSGGSRSLLTKFRPLPTHSLPASIETAADTQGPEVTLIATAATLRKTYAPPTPGLRDNI